MCNLGEGIREEAEQKTKVNAVLSLMKTLKLSVEDAVNALEVPAEDREALIRVIDGRLAVKQ